MYRYGLRKLLKKIKLSLPVDSNGRDPDVSRTSEEWDGWEKEMRATHPFLYWLNHDLPTYRYPITHKYRALMEWIIYRTTERYHILKTGSFPGYMEDGDRMLYACFNTLKSFVEDQKAWATRWDDQSKSKREIKRNGKELGLKYLDWEISLNNFATIERDGFIGQSTAAQEIKDLYLWWVEERPNRENPWGGALWDMYYKGAPDRRTLFNSRDSIYNDLFNKLSTRANLLDAMYTSDDTNKFKRLIIIRDSMWT